MHAPLIDLSSQGTQCLAFPSDPRDPIIAFDITHKRRREASATRDTLWKVGLVLIAEGVLKDRVRVS